jgi:membrane-bound lytic murein transglycosylase D
MAEPDRAPVPPAVHVRVGTSGPSQRFDRPFHIGRAENCDLRVQNEYVSRCHVQVLIENGRWLARDLASANGIFVNGQRLPEVPIAGPAMIRLGIEGPELYFALEPPPAPVQQPAVPSGDSTAMFAARYFTDRPGDEPVGLQTQMIRRAFQHVQKKQKRKHRGTIAGLLVVVAVIAGYAYYQHQHLAKQTAMAREIFYAMKSLEVDLANVERLVRDSGSQQGAEEIRKYRTRQKQMEQNYDRFLTSLRVYDPKMTEEQRLILRTARIFGECELDMPAGFVSEVQEYIKKWKSSGRLASAVRLAAANGYTPKITKELLGQSLPPQFFYLALQESNFEAFISGPPTYKGIAKGMWQFIPETAVKYGLRIGPLADFRRPDPADERHQWEKATVAAARYLKDIYSTDAQASGLLVMASYNWGEDKVVRLLRSMPANPRERNFWKVLADHRNKIPDETYNYVYYIFSAAVIGENPKLFGFGFDNPLGHLEGGA